MKRYVDVLNDAWLAATAPRVPGAPTVISLFAGCGGSSLGYHVAGFHEKLAVEWDPHAAECFRLNFPEVDLYQGDVSKLSVDAVLERTGLKLGELSLLDGSPPCQGFSTAGKRQLDDPRNQLFREYVRLLSGLRPRAFVMENVSGMVKGKMRLIFAEALTELQACGYRARAYVVDASQYGVPQKRIRLIVVGARNDTGVDPSFPEPTRDRVTVASACHGASGEVPQGLSALGKTLWKKTHPGKSASRSMGTENYFSSLKLHPGRPAPTLCKTNTGRGPSSMMHWREPRVVSISEAKRLQSFPDQFQLPGKYVDQWSRIGNSVPPLLVAALGRHIRSVKGWL